MFIARRDLGIRGQGEGHLKGPSFRAVLPGPLGLGFPTDLLSQTLLGLNSESAFFFFNFLGVPDATSLRTTDL